MSGWSRTCIICCTPILRAMRFRIMHDKAIYDSTYALPMTPHASFAIVPFSFSREKNPGLTS